MRILIADDERFHRTLLREMLESLGYKVVGLAQDGAEVVKMARNLRPDVVILDMVMPEMDHTNCKYYPEHKWCTESGFAYLCEHPDMESIFVDRRLACYPTEPCPLGGPFEKESSDGLNRKDAKPIKRIPEIR